MTSRGTLRTLRAGATVAGSLLSAVTALRQLRNVRRGDRLALANAAASALAVLTGLALAVRTLRDKDGDR
ncbi:MAG TPA: hypothetical protein VGD67_24145 [Pseudonocardiaceae bacterium]